MALQVCDVTGTFQTACDVSFYIFYILHLNKVFGECALWSLAILLSNHLGEMIQILTIWVERTC